MRRSLSLVTLFLVAAAAALPAAAAPSPNQLIARATAAAVSAKSVRVVATGVPNGNSTMSWDFHLVAGKGGAGFMTLGKDRIDLIRVGGWAYFRAGASFWAKYGKAAAQLVAGRWVKVNASNPDFADLTALTDIKQFFTGIFSSHGKLKLGGTKTINGTKAIGLIDATGKGGGALWIAASGTPYPLLLLPPSGPGQVSFESWNQPANVTAPRSSLDFAALTKKK